MDEGPSRRDGDRPNWRVACHESLRIINRDIIEQAILRQNAGVPNLAASSAADLIEVVFFDEATDEYHYLTMVSGYIQMIPSSPEFLQAGMRPPQLDRNQPPSEEHKGKEPLDVTTGPLEDLSERHNEVTDFLQMLMMFYVQQLNGERKMQNYASERINMHLTVTLHRKKARANFISALVQLKAEMKAYADDVNEFIEMRNSLEKWYERKIQRILEFFLRFINYDLNELPPDELHQYQQWLMSQEVYREYMSREDIEQAQYQERIFIGAGPSSAPVDFILRMRLAQQQNLPRRQCNSDRTSNFNWKTSGREVRQTNDTMGKLALDGIKKKRARRANANKKATPRKKRSNSDRSTAPVNPTSMMGHLDYSAAEDTGKELPRQQLGMLSPQQQEVLSLIFAHRQQSHQQQPLDTNPQLPQRPQFFRQQLSQPRFAIPIPQRQALRPRFSVPIPRQQEPWPRFAMPIPPQHAPQTRAPMPIARQQAPRRQVPMPIPRQQAPQTRAPLPIPPHQAPQTRASMPIPSQHAPQTRAPMPIPRQQAPRPQIPMPIPRQQARVPMPIPPQQAPQTRTPMPIPRQQAPRPQVPMPIPRQQAPQTRTPMPIPRQQAPRPQVPMPIPRQQAPRPQVPMPIPRQQAPRTQVPKPIPRHQAPRPQVPMPIPRQQAPQTRTPMPIPRQQAPRPQVPMPIPRQQAPHTRVPKPILQRQPEWPASSMLIPQPQDPWPQFTLLKPQAYPPWPEFGMNLPLPDLMWQHVNLAIGPHQLWPAVQLGLQLIPQSGVDSPQQYGEWWAMIIPRQKLPQQWLDMLPEEQLPGYVLAISFPKQPWNAFNLEREHREWLAMGFPRVDLALQLWGMLTPEQQLLDHVTAYFPLIRQLEQQQPHQEQQPPQQPHLQQQQLQLLPPPDPPLYHQQPPQQPHQQQQPSQFLLPPQQPDQHQQQPQQPHQQQQLLQLPPPRDQQHQQQQPGPGEKQTGTSLRKRKHKK